MTDKQIIIDGVDVSGCEFYWKEKELCNNGNLTSDCQENKDCLYKRYMRKEQECEELKDKLNCCFCNPYVELNDIEKQRKCIEVTECFRQQLDQLKAELEQEKALKETYLACYKAKHEDIEGELFKLKQTITEIKPILELYANSKVGEEQPDGTYKLSSAIWDSFGFCTTTYDPRAARKALQKISEVEDEKI